VALVNPENGVGLGFKYFDRAFMGPGDNLDIQVYGTSKNQAEAKVEHRRLRWRGTGWQSRAEAEGFYYPETWFGGGNNPRDEDLQIYTPLGARGELEAGHALGSGFFLKVSYAGGWMEMRSREDADGDPADPEVLGPELPGYRGGLDELLGISLELDTRDDERLPSRGWHAGHRVAHSLLRLDYSFSRTETWLAAYARPRPSWEAAVKGFQQTVQGDAPFYAYPYLGDKRLLRGIPEKRLRDRSAQAVQAEVRYAFRLALPLIARAFGDTWQLAAFAGAGRVGPDFGAASVAAPHFAGGLGGRLIIGKRLGAVRGDLGFSRFGYGLYVDFNQAF
jgi:outer membrane protein assembly factor BamA